MRQSLPTSLNLSYFTGVLVPLFKAAFREINIASMHASPRRLRTKGERLPACSHTKSMHLRQTDLRMSCRYVHSPAADSAWFHVLSRNPGAEAVHLAVRQPVIEDAPRTRARTPPVFFFTCAGNYEYPSCHIEWENEDKWLLSSDFCSMPT